ncbi:MAG: TonB-dependent receptor [Alphaproteobacteria bacterium]
MKQTLRVLTYAAGLTMATGAAFAQGDATTEAAANERVGRSTLETITVETKQSDAADIQSISTAVTGFSGVKLEREFAVTLEDFNHSIPNVQLEHVGLFQAAASFSMRGIGTAGIESFADPVVAVFVDGAYYSRNAVSLLDLFDIESIQALRGPQGTLYGRNAFAGAITVQTKRPEMDEFGGEFHADIGNAGRLNLGIIGNMPVVEGKVAIRIAANYHKLDGFYRNSGEVLESYDPATATLVTRIDEDLKGTRHNGEKSVYFRPSIRFTPNDRLDVSIIGEIWRDRGDGTTNPSQCYQPNSFPPPLGNGPSGATALHTAFGFPCKDPFGDARFNVDGDGSDPFESDFNLEPNQTNHDVWGITVDGSYDTEFGTFSLMFNHRDVDEDVTSDTDGYNYDVFSSTRLQVFKSTQFELRYNTTIAESIDILAGVFFLKDQYEVQQYLWIFADSALFGGGGFGRDNPFLSWGRNGQDRKTWAGYIQIDWNITDQFSVTLGGRYSWEKKYNVVGMAINDSNCPPGETIFTALCNGAPFAGNDPSDPTDFNPAVSFGPVADTWDAFSPRIGVDYQLNDDVLIFAFWQRAFKSGGFLNNAGSQSVFEDPFDQERVDNYEIGMKSDWLNDRLRVNMNVFHARYADLQRSVIREANTSTGQETFTDNAAGAKSWGVELEFSAIPVDGLTIFGILGWLDIQYKDFIADINGDGVLTDNSGLDLVRAPKWDMNFGFTYEFAVGNAGFVTIGSNVTHTSRLVLTVPNDFGFDRRPVTSINAQINWESANGKYRVSVWGKNLNNDIERLGGTPVGGLFAFFAATQPRQYGITAVANF